MCQAAYERYKAVYNQLETDAEYLALETQRIEQDVLFRAVMERLSQEQRAIVTDYIGICSEMAERSLEIACFLPESE